MTNRTEKGKCCEALHRAVPLGRFYDVGGRQLMLYASGTGGPAVVVLPGAGLTGLGYLNLHEQVSQFATSVLYDRAGTGWSDHVQLPRSATEVTDELRILLASPQDKDQALERSQIELWHDLRMGWHWPTDDRCSAPVG